MKETGLVQYDDMVRRIEAVHSVDEVVDLRDKARALEVYAQQAMNTEAERKACEIRLRAERKAGQMLAEMRTARALWMEDARNSFSPKDRDNCHICGLFKPVTEAHHVVPLCEQDERFEPDHTYVWLCPTHHAIVHRIIAATRGEISDFGDVLRCMTAEDLTKVFDVVGVGR